MWIRASSSVGLIALCACGSPQLEIVLVRDKSVQVTPEYLRFEVVHLNDGTVSKTGPYETHSMPSEEFTEVPPDEPFLVDVFGCNSQDESRCKPKDAIARGCSDELVLARGATRKEQIILFQPTLVNATCDSKRQGGGIVDQPDGGLPGE